MEVKRYILADIDWSENDEHTITEIVNNCQGFVDFDKNESKALFLSEHDFDTIVDQDFVKSWEPVYGVSDYDNELNDKQRSFFTERCDFRHHDANYTWYLWYSMLDAESEVHESFLVVKVRMTEVYEYTCIYCDAKMTESASNESNDTPAVNDDDAWQRLTASHSDGCEWIATKAFRV